MKEQYLPEIVELLQPIAPAKIILFGSQASGNADEDSDLDLIVVTNSDKLPANHREKEDAYLEVSRLLRDLRREVPMDLIVHTQPMHARFIEMNSLFARDVQQSGVVLYEADHA
ncbi:MAG: nucleotidyltransferase domain-containing protein [Anaerolineae bacterium]|nr:nucleotidyltransferase domain-containing protein [Anaerolineae bacterium]MCB0232939.1 nucleotidyltransferase domain-containing protein [Anaerolineae bacterium]